MTRPQRWLAVLCGGLFLAASLAVADDEAGQKKKKGGKKKPKEQAEGEAKAGGGGGGGGDRDSGPSPQLAEIERRILAYDTDQARRLLEESMDRQDTGYLTALGRVLTQEKNYARARSELAAAADRAPSDPEPLVHLGETLLWAGDEGAARDAFGRAESRARNRLSSSPGDAVARHHLGVALMRLERFDQAAEELERARRDRPRDPMVHFHLGMTRLAQERFGEAVDLLGRALEMDSGIAYAYYYRGLAANKIGRKDLMVNDLDRFLFLAPDAPEAPLAKRLLAAS